MSIKLPVLTYMYFLYVLGVYIAVLFMYINDYNMSNATHSGEWTEIIKYFNLNYFKLVYLSFSFVRIARLDAQTN